MTDRELRKLRRDDLLQILISQQKQNDALTAALDEAKKALEDRRIAVEESASIAEAALKLNGVFEAAQAAADQYQAEMRERADAVLAEAKANAESVVHAARTEAEQIIRMARGEAERAKREAAADRVEAQAPAVEAPQAEDHRHHGWFGRNKKA